jgi:hypothetical protein
LGWSLTKVASPVKGVVRAASTPDKILNYNCPLATRNSANHKMFTTDFLSFRQFLSRDLAGGTVSRPMSIVPEMKLETNVKSTFYMKYSSNETKYSKIK